MVVIMFSAQTSAAALGMLSNGMFAVSPPTIESPIANLFLQAFDNKADLQAHTQAHMREAKPYKCTQCVKTFANSSYLSQHMRIHLNIKPFGPCQYCGRKVNSFAYIVITAVCSSHNSLTYNNTFEHTPARSLTRANHSVARRPLVNCRTCNHTRDATKVTSPTSATGEE